MVLRCSVSGGSFASVSLTPNAAARGLRSLTPGAACCVHLGAMGKRGRSLCASARRFTAHNIPTPPVTSIGPVPEGRAAVASCVSIHLS